MKTLLQSMIQGAMNTESGLTIQNRAKNHVFSSVESKVQLLKIENDPKQLRNGFFVKPTSLTVGRGGGDPYICPEKKAYIYSVLVRQNK